MPTSDSTTHISSETNSKTASFIELAKSQIKAQALVSLNPILIIIRVTIIFILALLADYLIIMIIQWSFGGIVSHYVFAERLLEGIQLLSALGTAIAYIFYLIRSLFNDAKDVLEEFRGNGSQEEKSS